MTHKRNPYGICGLYAITPDLEDTKKLCSMVQASILGGAKIIQYRNKSAGAVLRIRQAQALLAICREYGARLIINDHIKLCLALDADGVHIGSEDLQKTTLADARERLGAHKILGVSCYGRMDLAVAAEHYADYVAFGACFPSSTKPEAATAALGLFNEAQQLSLPVVAIGGITLDNANLVIQAGADAIAMISALWNSPDIMHTSRQFNQLFTASTLSISL